MSILGNFFNFNRREDVPVGDAAVPREEDSIGRAKSALASHLEEEAVGPMARSAYAELDLLAQKRSRLSALISSRFPEGSLSHSRYADAVDMACEVAAENMFALAMRMDSFDVAEYSKLRYMLASGLYREDDVPDDIQEERGRMYREELSEMRAAVQANEKLLLELDRLAQEIRKTGAEADSGNEDIAREIRVLIDELQYYQ